MQALKSEASASSSLSPFFRRLLEIYQSDDFRLAVRVGIAVVISYYISLAMGWAKPQWTGLSVVLCSLATLGDSLHKGALRILGTAIAAVVAMALVVLFPQDRWVVILACAGWVGFCTYLMGRSSLWYCWSIAGYVMVMLVLDAKPPAGEVFHIMVLRIQQTTLGIVVFTLVSIFLWPAYKKPRLVNSVAQLIDGQRRLLSTYFSEFHKSKGEGDKADEAAALRAQVTGTIAMLSADVDAAEIESAKVQEKRHLWRRCVSDFAELNQAMLRWQKGFPDLKTLDIQGLLPGLPDLQSRLDSRLVQISDMVKGQEPGELPEEYVIRFDDAAYERLAPFDQAALRKALDQLRMIEELTRRLFSRIAEIAGFVSATEAEGGR